MNKWIIICLVCLSNQVHAQHSTLLQEYRSKVKAYNQDIKMAGYDAAIQREKQKSAKADFLPALSGNANFGYKGNPSELSVTVPSLNESLNFQGQHNQYGASLTLAQPVYTGGALKAGYEKAKKENEQAQYEQQRIINDIMYDADVYYWNKVARQEMIAVAEEYKTSVSALVEVVKDRVTEEYTDRNDLLMAEVRLNDAEYRFTQSCNDAEVARMSMNSFSGVSFDKIILTDSVVIPLTTVQAYTGTVETAMASRPELRIATNEVAIQKSAFQIANAQYLPRLSVGIDGNYSSPGYDFRSGPDPNYIIYAQLSIPIFEWGKRKNTRRTGEYSINKTIEQHQKVADNIRLEIETAFYTYSQAVEKVRLTENSLAKAAESEKMAMDKYKEGNVSIIEVINAQLYHQEARINYIQSKLNAQIAKSAMDRATGSNINDHHNTVAWRKN